MKYKEPLMNEETFWNLIAQSNQDRESEDKSGQVRSLKNFISNLDELERLGFWLMYKIL